MTPVLEATQLHKRFGALVAVLREQQEYCQMLQTLAAQRKRGWAELDLVFPSRLGTPLPESNLSQLMRDLASTLGITHTRFG